MVVRRWKGKGGKRVGVSVNIKKKEVNAKKIREKLEKNRIMTWTLMWLNWSVATIYIYIYIYIKYRR